MRTLAVLALALLAGCPRTLGWTVHEGDAGVVDGDASAEPSMWVWLVSAGPCSPETVNPIASGRVGETTPPALDPGTHCLVVMDLLRGEGVCRVRSAAAETLEARSYDPVDMTLFPPSSVDAYDRYVAALSPELRCTPACDELRCACPLSSSCTREADPVCSAPIAARLAAASSSHVCVVTSSDGPGEGVTCWGARQGWSTASGDSDVPERLPLGEVGTVLQIEAADGMTCVRTRTERDVRSECFGQQSPPELPMGSSVLALTSRDAATLCIDTLDAISCVRTGDMGRASRRFGEEPRGLPETMRAGLGRAMSLEGARGVMVRDGALWLFDTSDGGLPFPHRLGWYLEDLSPTTPVDTLTRAEDVWVDVAVSSAGARRRLCAVSAYGRIWCFDDPGDPPFVRGTSTYTPPIDSLTPLCDGVTCPMDTTCCTSTGMCTGPSECMPLVHHTDGDRFFEEVEMLGDTVCGRTSSEAWFCMRSTDLNADTSLRYSRRTGAIETPLDVALVSPRIVVLSGSQVEVQSLDATETVPAPLRGLGNSAPGSAVVCPP